MTKVIALYVTGCNGAPEFKRQAEAFGRIYGLDSLDLHPFAPWDSGDVEGVLRAHGGYQADLVAVFCHGWRNQLMTGHAIGWRSKLHRAPVSALASAMACALKRDGKVVLYACSTAGTPNQLDPNDHPAGDSGFADTLRDELGYRTSQGGWVDAHVVAGHTTMLPLVRRFVTDGDYLPSPGLGGEWIVSPRTPEFAEWRRELEGDMRFRYPLLTIEQIRAQLAGTKAA